MLKIDRLSLNLPPGFEPRADNIARQVGHELARLPFSGVHRIEHLRVPPVNVHPDQSDTQIAATIAQGIATSVTAGRR